MTIELASKMMTSYVCLDTYLSSMSFLKRVQFWHSTYFANLCVFFTEGGYIVLLYQHEPLHVIVITKVPAATVSNNEALIMAGSWPVALMYLLEIK